MRATTSLIEPHAFEPRCEHEAVEAGPGLARRARAHVVDQDRAELAAFGICYERSHNRLHWTDRPKLDEITAYNSAIGAEYHEVHLHALEKGRALILCNEIDPTATLEGFD